MTLEGNCGIRHRSRKLAFRRDAAMEYKRMTYLRKKPRQARARVTCAAIVEAAARILSEEGAARLTTNRIAERAGVSVGSLYQYFPNRHAERPGLANALSALAASALPREELRRLAALRTTALTEAATRRRPTLLRSRHFRAEVATLFTAYLAR